MKAFILCASIFLFAAANASPSGLGYRSLEDRYGYGLGLGRSDDHAVEAPTPASDHSLDTIATTDDIHDSKIRDIIKLVKNFLSYRKVGIVVVHPQEDVEEKYRHPVV